MGTTTPKLRGLWKSDRKRTVGEWRFKKFRNKAKRAKFLKMFGKLEISYGAKFVRVKFEDNSHKDPYRIEASDATTVVIRHFEDKTDKVGGLQCLNFEGPDLYWINVGWNREWFRRVRK